MKLYIQGSENPGFRLLLERKERDRIFKMGVGVQTGKKESGVVGLSEWVVLVLRDPFAGKGEWYEDLHLSVRVTNMLMCL